MGKKSINEDRMIRIDGAGCFVEALCGMMKGNRAEGREGKVVLNFVKYDKNRPSGQRTLCEIPIYIDIAEFLVLADSIRMGTISRLIADEKQKAASENRYAEGVWKTQGGTVVNGSVTARVLQIIPATAANAAPGSVVLSAQKGPGRVADNGLIVPQFDFKKKNFDQIMVAMKIESLKEIAIVVSMYYQAMLTSSWMNGEFVRKISPSSNENSANQVSQNSGSQQPSNPAQSEHYEELPEEYDDMPFQ